MDRVVHLHQPKSFKPSARTSDRVFSDAGAVRCRLLALPGGDLTRDDRKLATYDTGPCRGFCAGLSGKICCALQCLHVRARLLISALQLLQILFRHTDAAGAAVGESWPSGGSISAW